MTALYWARLAFLVVLLLMAVALVGLAFVRRQDRGRGKR